MMCSSTTNPSPSILSGCVEGRQTGFIFEVGIDIPAEQCRFMIQGGCGTGNREYAYYVLRILDLPCDSVRGESWKLGCLLE